MGLFDFWKKKPPASAPRAKTRPDKNPWARPAQDIYAPEVTFADDFAPLGAKKVATQPIVQSASPLSTITGPDIRRHFYNESGFQTYASFFAHWKGWVTAGHCLTEAADLLPDFADGDVICHPDGLDAALIGCELPDSCPAAPYPGQDIICIGYPAGCRTPETRHGKVYMQRPNAPSWIAHIIDPDEPVVTGMSGGAVIDSASGTPIGIIITRNSPADLNNDRDPDESCDFTALTDLWRAVRDGGTNRQS